MERSLAVGCMMVAAALAAGCNVASTRESDAAEIDAASARDGGHDAASASDAGDVHDAASARDGGGDAALDAGADASDIFGDGGAPPWVDIAVNAGRCDVETPCAGDVVGTWDVTGGCVNVSTYGEGWVCPWISDPPDGGVFAMGGHGRARGRLTFDGTTVSRAIEWIADAEVTFSDMCAVGTCEATGGFLGGWTCRTEPGACHCTIEIRATMVDELAYTIDGATHEIVSTPERHPYCVVATSLAYGFVESTADGNDFGAFDLRAR